MRTRASEAIVKWNLTKHTCEQQLVESDYEWMAVSPEMEPPVDINYTVSLASVVWLRETLVVCD